MRQQSQFQMNRIYRDISSTSTYVDEDISLIIQEFSVKY